jgi:hypothetical protein
MVPMNSTIKLTRNVLLVIAWWGGRGGMQDGHSRQQQEVSGVVAAPRLSKRHEIVNLVMLGRTHRLAFIYLRVA